MMGFSHQTSWNSRTKTIFNGLVLLGNWIAENVDFKSCYHVDFPSNHVWGWWRWVHIVPGDRSWIIYGSFKEDLIDLCLVFQSTAERVFSPSNVSACCWLSVLSMFWPLDLGIEYNMLSMVVLKGQRILNGMSIFSELVSNCHNLFVSWRKSNHNWIVMFELTLCRNLDVFQHVHDDIWRHVLLHGLPCCGCCHWYFMLLLVVSHLVTGGFPGCPLSKHETCALEGCGRELSQKLYIFNDSDLHKLGQATGQGINWAMSWFSTQGCNIQIDQFVDQQGLVSKYPYFPLEICPMLLDLGHVCISICVHNHYIYLYISYISYMYIYIYVSLYMIWYDIILYYIILYIIYIMYYMYYIVLCFLFISYIYVCIIYL
jgi:hypothetical protein